MSTLSTTYTPLESLLLFQALRANGVEPSAFNRISADLKSIPLVRNDPSYDDARLAPDALRQLYLDLLKEEAKYDLEKQLNASANGHVSPNIRKRKAPSPKLPTIREAAQHSHLIPQLVTRLYMRYREVTVATIREHEEQYESLVGRTGAGDATQEKKPDLAEVPSSSGTSEVIVSATVAPQQKPAAPTKRSSQARIDDMLNRASPSADDAAHRRTSSGNSMPSLSDVAGLTPSQAPNSSSRSANSAGFAYQPSALYHSPAAAYSVPMRPGSSHGSPQVQSLTPRTSASPRPVLPPPPGMHPVSPSMSYQARAQPGQQAAVRQNQPPPQPPQPQPYSAGSYQQPYQPSYQANSRGGGVMLPPFQLTPSDPARAQHAPYPQQHHYSPQHQPAAPPYRPDQHVAHPYPSPGQYRHQPPVYNAPSTGPRPQHLATQRRHPLSGLVAALATPPRIARQPVWKSENRPPPLSAPGSPKRPDVEPLSPLLARASSPSHTSAAAIRRQANAARGTRKQTSQVGIRQEMRSASVESTANGSEDTHSSRKRIKAEPSTPVVRDSEEVDGGIVTRKRRGTIQSGPGAKRQRQSSSQPSKQELNQDEPAPTRSNTVTAARNFGRMSSVIMNEIVSHKHGSRFAQPVRDSHAEGYSSFIKRPQDLKSIRAAISQGGKAIVAATANTAESPVAANAPASATVELERSIDLIPPKAIVNGAQLEKELMRMFANAVMFNPGEDGMVADTREMFEDVEAKIAEWRGAEREVGSSTVAAEEEEDSRAKRRKL